MTLVVNLLEIVRNIQWSEKDKEPIGMETIITKGWGLDRGTLDGLRRKVKRCKTSIPNVWAPPPRSGFKINFDGEDKGDPGAVDYGVVCRNLDGEILLLFYGSIGFDTINPVELEGLLEGLKIMVREGWLPTIIEGDSNILIGMVK